MKVLNHVAWEVPQLADGVCAEVTECEFFLLWEIEVDFHFVHGACVWELRLDERFNKLSSDDEESGGKGLVHGQESEVSILAHEIVEVCGTASPVTQDEYGSFFLGDLDAFDSAGVYDFFEEAQG